MIKGCVQKYISGLFIALFMLMILSFSAVAQAKTYTLSSWLPESHPFVQKGLIPWVQEVNRVTKGRVNIVILKNPLGAANLHYDLTRHGLADLSYGLHSFSRGEEFTRAKLGQFSFLGNSAEEVSVGFWQVYTRLLDGENEHQGVKLLSAFVQGAGLLHSNAGKVNNITDFKGMNIHSQGGYVGEILKKLGAELEFNDPLDVKSRLHRGVVSAVTFPAGSVADFDLTEEIQFTQRISGGLYNTSWFLVMNEGAWKGVSQRDRQAIEKISGEAMARKIGQFWDASDKLGWQQITEAKIKVSTFSPEVTRDIKKLSQDYEREWIEALAGQGFDGEKALRTLRNITGVVY